MNYLTKLIQPEFCDCKYKIYLFTTQIDDSLGSTIVDKNTYDDFFNKIKQSNIFNYMEDCYEKINYLNYEIINNNYYDIQHILHTKIKDMIIQIDNSRLIKDSNSINEINNQIKENISTDNYEKIQIKSKIFHDKINNFKIIFENEQEIYITFTLNEKNVKIILDLLNKISKIK